MSDHLLPHDLPQAGAAYVASMPPGSVQLFPLTALDRTGVPCWNAIFLNADDRAWHGVAPHGVGYGATDESAIVGTLGELAEAVHSAAELAKLPRKTGNYASLRLEGAVDPLTMCLPAGSPVDHDTVLQWVPAHRWPSGETVLLPIDIAACSVGDLEPGYAAFTTPITNGLGAGPTLDFAIGHGVCELLQRDGNGLGFRAMDRGIALDLGDGPRDPATRALLDKLRGLGIDVTPKFADDEFGVANVYVVGADHCDAAFPIMTTAAGEAASLDREHALKKAVLEFAAARARKTFSHAPLSRSATVAPAGYLDRFRRYHTLGGEESRTLRSMTEWLALDQAALEGLLSDTVLSRRTAKRFDELPQWDGELSGTPLLTELSRRLAVEGMEILYFDFSPKGTPGVHVVKAFVPGLEVETMSYHRIGERGVRKLMARGLGSRGTALTPMEREKQGLLDLVGFGEPPPGALPVRLPPDAAARLGGAPWLDVARVDRIVGRLYPLYREPEVHSAPIAMEARR